MTNEDKKLLLTDLCTRLPYGVICNLYDPEDTNKKFKLMELSTLIISAINSGCIKPYLRPMSSMTDKEKKELYQKTGFKVDDYILGLSAIDWLLTRHFDFRGLIEKGLALEAPDVMYKTK